MELDLTQASIADIANFYSPTPSPWLRANMVVSQDGSFVDANGSSRGLSSPLDLKVLLTLRAISDAVLVGAQTVRVEDYRTPVLAGEYKCLNTKDPRLVVISRDLEFDLSTRLFANPSNKPIIITPKSESTAWNNAISRLNDVAEIHILPNPLDFKLVSRVLSELNLVQVVCEGGPQLLAELIEQDLIDEIDITRTPVNVGQTNDISKASAQVINAAITSWPNRVTAKLGSQQLVRIKR